MTTTVTPQGTSQAECALSALPGETPGNSPNLARDITGPLAFAVSLCEAMLGAEVIE